MRLICAFAGGCCFQVWGHGFSPTGRGAGFRKSAQFSANFTVCRLLPSCAGLSAARGLCLTSPSAIPCGQAPRHSGSCAHYAGLRVSTGRGHCIPARHAGGPAHMSGDSIFSCNRLAFTYTGGTGAPPGDSICKRLPSPYAIYGGHCAQLSGPCPRLSFFLIQVSFFLIQVSFFLIQVPYFLIQVSYFLFQAGLYPTSFSLIQAMLLLIGAAFFLLMASPFPARAPQFMAQGGTFPALKSGFSGSGGNGSTGCWQGSAHQGKAAKAGISGFWKRFVPACAGGPAVSAPRGALAVCGLVRCHVFTVVKT